MRNWIPIEGNSVNHTLVVPHTHTIFEAKIYSKTGQKIASFTLWQKKSENFRKLPKFRILNLKTLNHEYVFLN